MDNPAVQNAKIQSDKKGKSDARFEKIEEKVQKDVLLLIQYAISEERIKLDNNMIQSVIPILRKPPSELEDTEKTELWKSYNSLSESILPATIEYIKSRGKFFLSLVIVLLLFVFFQSYVIFLSDVVRDIENHQTAMNSVISQIDTVNSAKYEISDSAEKAKSSVTDSLITQRDTLDLKIRATNLTLDRAAFLWKWIHIAGSGKDTVSDISKNTIHNPHYKVKYISLAQEAKSVLQILTFYIIPAILGLLGAIAYICRRLLSGPQDHGFSSDSIQRFWTRLILGALLGAISGIFLMPEQPQLQPFKLTLVAFSFLLGYSVEFAFKIFDSLIQKAIQVVTIPTPRDKVSDKPEDKDVPQTGEASVPPNQQEEAAPSTS